MPRPTLYLVEGYTYHLTHRCHNQEFLLRFARDRDAYRGWLREAARRYGVPVYGYCITSNHVHILARATDREALADMMRLGAGSTAKQYNIRKERGGSQWEHPYHCTLVQDGDHLLNCLVYINLNMVRAGQVSHPSQWRWCGHDELVGDRKRFRILDLDGLLASLGRGSIDELRAWYAGAVEQRIAARQLAREAHWSSGLAVGDREFTERARSWFTQRRRIDLAACGNAPGAPWVVREEPPAYGGEMGGEKRL